ncbi:SDR family oxidoreductase [Tunicatimonas pelagia]|uniref:SDR family oxidoreductase n=1 Tax=Tunicatimonas pelagia TaxID=931531 RepID=UPI0026662F21|nr:NAD(P)H-binding protein [Tunicatimonas pelagia]WKN46190.1 NAD(P)H-binding protein [Tunicatimonas pelagia]
MKSKVLVLGSTGLIGRIVTQQLVTDDFLVKVLARNPAKAEKMFGNQVEIISGDAINRENLKAALTDCEQVHISLSQPAELVAVRHVVSLTTELSLQKISYVSGSTVSEENNFFPMIKDKLEAEQLIQGSGVPYQIFKPTIFREALANFVNNGRASVLGKQTRPYHLVSGQEFARLVSQELLKEENFYQKIFGKQSVTLNKALEEYCTQHHPQIKKVTNLPYGIAKFIAWLTRTPTLKEAANFFAYLEKVGEGYPEEKQSTISKQSGRLGLVAA